MVCTAFLLMSVGCSVQSIGKEHTRELAFETVTGEQIPKELASKMAEMGMKPFQMTYSDQGALYIARGYGEKETGGYRVLVTSCRESERAVYIHTKLLGPSKEEQIVREPMNPQIVVKIRAADRNVVFE